MYKSLTIGIDLSEINLTILSKVIDATGANGAEITEGWCMDGWAGPNAMLELLECHGDTFRAANKLSSSAEVIEVFRNFRRTRTSEEIQGNRSELLFDRFLLRKIYALFEKHR